MAEEPDTKQSISDDQELAKVLAGVQGEEGTPATDDDAPSQAETSEHSDKEVPASETEQAPSSQPSAGEFDGIKVDALHSLRPLVDKLNVSPEEKFDTYLLLLRSTDDKDLIAPAHEAAKAIPDEVRRAHALLDIIKEIDFLTQNQK